jgi:hypothetical protein
MTETETKMYKASVPKLARIVGLLGGWDPILEDGRAMGAAYVISLDKDVILTPDDDRDDDTEIAFPRDDDPGHTFKALHITMMWEDERDWHVDVGLWGRAGGPMGDPYAERTWEFRVPKEGWAEGEWSVYGTLVQAAFVGSWRETADHGERTAKELAADATGFDRENLIVDGCLRLVEKEKGAKS